METLVAWVEHLVSALNGLAPPGSYLALPFVLYGLFAVVLVSLICGSVGALVVGNRMAFYSDALAHCAFAGVGLGLLLSLVTGVSDKETFLRGVTLIMVVFGAAVGLAIAYVREKTALASDTVIGVFFAGSMGFGAMLFKAISVKQYFNPENFLFGELLGVGAADLLQLVALALATAAVQALMYNRLVFASFNPSLARSRRFPVRLLNYVFIALLAVIVNVCLRSVGALLINAFLIVPAATAANLARNMRQMYWLTVALSLLSGLLGYSLSFLDFSVGAQKTQFGPGGLIVVVSVTLFFLSTVVGPWLRNRKVVAPAA